MDGATQTRGAGGLSCLLAGLQSGMQGVVAMLAWLGVSATWQQRSFWTSENLMASVFYGNRAIHSGFAGSTVSGLAVYLLLYSLLGGLLAFFVRERVNRLRILLISLVFALVWYYLSYRVIWKAVAPLIALLHVERATVLGHLVYGTLLARYPVYLHPRQATPAATAPPSEPPSATPAETAELPSGPAEPAPASPTAQPSPPSDSAFGSEPV